MQLTHHAYYIEDSLTKLSEYSEHLRASEGFAVGDPNFSVRQFEKFGIDEARALIEITSLKNTASRAVCIIGAASMTHEAQQALLKLFEEPQEGTVFVLLVPHGILLPTLKSRALQFSQLPNHHIGRTYGSQQAQEFLSWPYKKRSDWITGLLKDNDDAREVVRSFLNELEGELYVMAEKSKEVREGLSEIAHFRQYLSDRAPSLKMILEHFAATLPPYK